MIATCIASFVFFFSLLLSLAYKYNLEVKVKPAL